MNLHREVHFEEPICEHLSASGWLYVEDDAEHYDRARALFPADVLARVRETQPKGWEALTKSHGAATDATLLDRLRKQMNECGTLDVLRHGIELLGLRRPLAMVQFKPALAMNPDLQARYAANRLRVVRQVRYSLYNENAINLMLFLNGNSRRAICGPSSRLPTAAACVESSFVVSLMPAPRRKACTATALKGRMTT